MREPLLWLARAVRYQIRLRSSLSLYVRINICVASLSGQVNRLIVGCSVAVNTVESRESLQSHVDFEHVVVVVRVHWLWLLRLSGRQVVDVKPCSSFGKFHIFLI